MTQKVNEKNITISDLLFGHLFHCYSVSTVSEGIKEDFLPCLR